MSFIAEIFSLLIDLLKVMAGVIGVFYSSYPEQIFFSSDSLTVHSSLEKGFGFCLASLMFPLLIHSGRPSVAEHCV